MTTLVVGSLSGLLKVSSDPITDLEFSRAFGRISKRLLEEQPDNYEMKLYH